MGCINVKIQTDVEECGKDCPFLRLDAGNGVLQCTLFVEVLHMEDKRSLIVSNNGKRKKNTVSIYRADSCKRMEEL
jgi:hypothetical protein